MPTAKVVPRLVPDRLEQRRGADDVGERERSLGHLAGSGRPELGDALGDTARVGHRAEPLQRGSRGLELQDGAVAVAVDGERLCQQDRGPGRLVRRVDLAPELTSLAEPPGRARRAALGEVGEPVCPLGPGADRVRRVIDRDRIELVGRRPRRDGIARRACDLGLRRQQPGSDQAVPVLVLEAAADRRGGGVDLALSEQEKRPTRLRVLAHLVRLPECVLRARQVAHPQPDLTELVERRAGVHRAEVEQLIAGAAQLGLRLAPGAEQPHDLGAVHSADAGEPVDRLSLAPALGRLRPLVRAPIIGEVATGADDVAEHRAGRVGAELVPDGGRAHVLEQRPALVDAPQSHKDHPAVHRAPRTQARVVEPAGDLEATLDVLEGVIELAPGPRQLPVREREVPVRDRLGLALEQALRTVEPPLGDRAGELHRILPAKREGGERRFLRVAPVDVRRVRALSCLDRFVLAADPPRGLCEQLEVFRLELACGVGAAQRLVRLGPRATSDGVAPGRQRHLERLGRAHALILPHAPGHFGRLRLASWTSI
jgi:hypothetical protein